MDDHLAIHMLLNGFIVSALTFAGVLIGVGAAKLVKRIF